MFACIVARMRSHGVDCIAACWRSATELSFSGIMGCYVGRFAGRIMSKGRRVISDALHGHRMIQESGRESGLSPLPREGRRAPDGLDYVESWVETNFDHCFQLMECADLRLLEQWADRWRDLVDFEFVPVPRSKEAAELISVEV